VPVAFEVVEAIARESSAAAQHEHEQQQPRPRPAAEDADAAERENASVKLEIVLTRIAFRLLHDTRCPKAAHELRAWATAEDGRVANRSLFLSDGALAVEQ
jgi:hypothetical protein